MPTRHGCFMLSISQHTHAFLEKHISALFFYMYAGIAMVFSHLRRTMSLRPGFPQIFGKSFHEIFYISGALSSKKNKAFPLQVWKGP
jgi:hypothetical protein